MRLFNKILELNRRGITIELSNEAAPYAMIVLRGRHSTIVRLVPGDISENDLIDYIEDDLVREVEERPIF